MKDYKFSYRDQDGKIRGYSVNATSTASALLYARNFCKRFNFVLTSLVVI